MKNKFMRIAGISMIIVIMITVVGVLAYLFSNPFYARKLIANIEEQNYDALETACHSKIGNIDAQPTLFTTFRKIAELPAKPNALYYACQQNDSQAVEILLKNGADPNGLPKHNMIPLVVAAAHGNTHMIELLIEYGADVLIYAQPSLISQLRYGVRTGKVSPSVFEDTVLIFEKNGFDINTKDESGSSIFLQAALIANMEIARFLVEEKQMSVNETNSLGQTALHLACMSGWTGAVNAEYVSFLLEHGADANIRDEQGKRAYDYAIEKGYREIAELLE